MRGRIIHGPSPTTTAALSLLALLTIGCAHASSSPRAQACADSFDPAAVTAVLDRQREAWNVGDLEGFLAGYERSEALLFTSGAKIRRGFEETREKYRARYGEAPETMGVLSFEILDVRGLGSCSEGAIVLGRWGLSETAQAGSGVFSLVLERQGDEWLIVHDHTSADPPSP
ncbi:MAG: DUF4440 domain-containing protein [Enhygromyxa sp.]